MVAFAFAHHDQDQLAPSSPPFKLHLLVRHPLSSGRWDHAPYVLKMPLAPLDIPCPPPKLHSSHDRSTESLISLTSGPASLRSRRCPIISAESGMRTRAASRGSRRCVLLVDAALPHNRAAPGNGILTDMKLIIHASGPYSECGYACMATVPAIRSRIVADTKILQRH
jgi:hypothetical protein